MTLNDKRDEFVLEDLRAVARSAWLPRGCERRVLAELTDAVARWPQFAEAAGVPRASWEAIGATHRLHWPAKG